MATDRPSESAGPSVVPTGTVQIESGYKLSRTGGSLTQDLPDLLVRFGASKRFETRVSWTGWTFRDDSVGANDATVGAKILVAQERGRRPAVSLLGEVSLPTGSDGFTEDAVSPKVLVLFNHSLSERLSAVYNLGARFVEMSGGRRSADLVFTALLAGTIDPKLEWFVELFGNFHGENSGWQHTLQAGWTHLLGARVQWDLRVAHGLTAGATDWTIGCGLSYRLPR